MTILMTYLDARMFSPGSTLDNAASCLIMDLSSRRDKSVHILCVYNIEKNTYNMIRNT